MMTTTLKKEKVETKSAADFFHDNKAIAGFDNSMRVVFTSVRELVENGLDAAEKIDKLPNITVKIEKLSVEEVARLLNISKDSLSKSRRLDFLKLTVRDNGSGVPAEDVPLLFGRVLTGSNYGARQTRGRFGLGAKMVLLNAMATVDLPITIMSRHFSTPDTTSLHRLFIDLQKNEPIIETELMFESESPNFLPETGTEVTVTFTGSWNLAKNYIKEYFHQLAIITPYATLNVELPGEGEGLKDELILERVVDEMPPYPKHSKIHVWGCDITQLKREINVTRYENAQDFFKNHFEGFRGLKGDYGVLTFLDYTGIDPNKNPSDLTSSEIRRIVHEGFQVPVKKGKKRKKAQKKEYFKFIRPKGDSLSPLGDKRLEKGIIREIDDPDAFIVSRSSDVLAYSGHPFVIEAALAYTGRMIDDKKKLKIYRYANRIPLLFGQGNDVITKVIQDENEIDWKKYKVNLQNTPLVIAVSLVSTKIPFPETSKEYIADVDEIRKAVKTVLSQLGTKLGTEMSKRARRRREGERVSKFQRLAPQVVDSLISVVSDREDLPFSLNYIRTLAVRSLAENHPKEVPRRFPPSQAISRLSLWLDDEIKSSLNKKGVITICDFLHHPASSDVFKMKGKSLPRERILEVKRSTVKHLDLQIESPKITTLSLFDSDIEKGFDKQFPKTERALSKKWISTVYDFFSTSVDKLIKIDGFFEKTLMQYKKDSVKYLNSTLPENSIDHSLDGLSWLDDKLKKELLKNNIYNALDFITAFPSELYQDTNLVPTLLTRVKRKVQRLTELKMEKISGLSKDFPWVTGEIRKELNSSQVQTWGDFFSATLTDLKKIKSLRDKLIAESIIEVVNMLKKRTNALTVDALPFMTDSLLRNCKEKKILSLYDFLAYADFSDKPAVKKIFVSMLKDRMLKRHNESVNSSYVEHGVWIPKEIEDYLARMNIKNVFDFLSAPALIIAGKGDILTLDRVRDIKRKLGTPVNYLPKDLAQVLNDELGTVCSEELINLTRQNIPKEPRSRLWPKIRKIQELLDDPINFLPGLKPMRIKSLALKGIVKISDFLIWQPHDYSQTMEEITDYFQILNEFKIDELRDSVANKTPVIDFFGFSEELKENLKIIGYETIEELYFARNDDLVDLLIQKMSKIDITHFLENPARKINDHKVLQRHSGYKGIRSGLKKTKKIKNVSDFLLASDVYLSEHTDLNDEEIYFLKRQIIFENIVAIKKKIERPISYLKCLTLSQIKRLKNNGYKTLIDLLICKDDNYLEMFPDGNLTSATIKSNLKEFYQGTNLKGLQFLNDTEISILEREKVYTIEELYFSTRKETYGLVSSGEEFLEERKKRILTWDRITEIRHSLELPVSLLAFEIEDTDDKKNIDQEESTSESDIKQELLSPKHISALQSAGVEQIIDFFIAREDDIVPLLNITPEQIVDYRNRLILKEKGVSLKQIVGVGKKELKLLNSKELETVEDIYFIAKEEMFDEPDDWRWVQVLRRSLEVPISFVNIIRPEIAKKLESRDVKTLIKFLMLQPYEIAEMTGSHEETIENIIERINLVEIGQALQASVSVIPGIPPVKYKKLAKESIVQVGDFLLAPDEKITTLIEDKINVAKIKKDLTMESVNKYIEENVISVSSVYKITKTVERKLETLNFNSISKIYYSAEEDSFPDQDLWFLILDIQKLLSLPVSTIPGINRDHLPDFIDAGVTRIIDFLMWSEENLVSLVNDDKGSVVTIKEKFNLKEIKDRLMIPLIAVGLPYQLEGEEFTTIFDFLSASEALLAKKLGKTPKEMLEIKLGIDIDDFGSKLDIPLTFSFDFTSEDLKALSRRRITNLGQFLTADPEKIQETMNITNEKYEVIIENCDFQRVNEALETSILYVSILGSEKKQILTLNKSFSVRDLFLSDKKLIEQKITSKRRSKEITSELTLDLILKLKKEFSFPLEKNFSLSDDFKEFVQETSMTDIFSLVLAKPSFDSEKLESEYELMINAFNSPIGLLDFIPAKKKKNFLDYGILTVLDFFYWDNRTIGKLLEKDPEEIQKMKSNLNLSGLHEKREQGTPLSNFKKIKPKTLKLFEENGIKFLEDLFLEANLAMIEDEAIKKEVNQLKSFIESPIAFHTELSSQEKIDLIDSGINTISEIIFTDDSGIWKDLDEKQINTIKFGIDFEKLKNLKEKRGIDMSFMSAFNQRTVEKLKKDYSYIMTFEDIYYTLNTSKIPTSLAKTINAFKLSYEAPITTMMDLEPANCTKLADQDFRSVSKFILAKTSELVKILDIPEDQVRKIKYSQNFSKLRKKRKQGVPIACYKEFKVEQVEKLRENGIETIEELYFYARKHVITDVIGEELFNQFLEHMNSPVTSLDSIPISLGPVFKRNKIERVIEFLYWPLTVLRKITKLPYEELKLMKNDLKFIDKDDMKKKIDALLG
ncbi:MAG: DNA topoisomerase VI subunit B, partial [Candidatus Hodarchaeales archaeon]